MRLARTVGVDWFAVGGALGECDSQDDVLEDGAGKHRRVLVTHEVILLHGHVRLKPATVTGD